MSKKYPQCPLYDHRTCKDCYNPSVCALCRMDQRCLKHEPVKPAAKKESPQSDG